MFSNLSLEESRTMLVAKKLVTQQIDLISIISVFFILTAIHVYLIWCFDTTTLNYSNNTILKSFEIILKNLFI